MNPVLFGVALLVIVLVSSMVLLWRHRKGSGDRIVFLFGAGASYGAGSIDPSRPPLMLQLHAELAREYPAEWGESSRLWSRRADFERDFEAAFGKHVLGNPPDKGMPPFRADSLTIAESFLWPLAFYFARFTLNDGMDCYTRLLRPLVQRVALDRVTFASLNYDCLFEQAAARLGHAVQYGGISEDASGNHVNVLKLHGSCNFVAGGFVNSQWTRALLSSATIVEMRPRALATAGLTPSLRSAQGANEFPYLSLISPLKESITGQMALQRIQQQWRGAVADSDCLVIVGVSCNTNDRHVVEPVSTAARILYIGSKEQFEKWRDINPRITHVGTEFKASLSRLKQRI